MNIVLVLFILFLFSFCTPAKNIKEHKNSGNIDNRTFLEKVKTLGLKPEDLKKLGNDEIKLWNVVEDVLNSNFYAVEQKCREILRGESANQFRFEFMKLLAYSLFYQSKWNELLPANNSYYYDPDSVFLLAKVFARIGPQEVSFTRDVDTIAFETAPNGAIIVKVLVNGKTRNFWFDTGTNYSIVSSKTAEDCNLPVLSNETSKAITHTNFKVDVRPTYIQSFKLGNLEIRNHPCLVIDDYNMKLQLFASNIPVEIYGIVGWKTIQNAKYTIDYEGRIIIVEKPKRESNTTGNFFWCGIPTVIGKYRGENILFAFDLGSEKSYLTQNIFNKINFQEIYQQTRRVGSIGGWKYNPTVIVPYFEVFFDSIRISFNDIGTVDFAKDYFFQVDGIFGLDLVKKVRISFDIVNSKFQILKK